MEIIGYFVILCIGIVLGSIGAGGSMLAIPVLVYVFSIGVETATAYSLFLVGTTSLTGAILKQKAQMVSLRMSLFFGIPSIIGSFVSRKWLIVAIPEIILTTNSFTVTKGKLLLGVFAIMMITSSVMLLLRRKTPIQTDATARPGLLMLSGITTGLVAGLIGAGGGFLIIPALLLFARLPFAMATGTSLLIIAANSMLGFCGDIFNRSIDWPFLVMLTALSLAGVTLGIRWQSNVSSGLMPHRAFAVFTLLVAIVILIVEVTGVC